METVDAVLKRYADLILAEYLRLWKPHESSGNMYAVAKAKVVNDKDGDDIDFVLASYWEAIEYGRKPGTWGSGGSANSTFKQNIVNYIRQKPVVPTPYVTPTGKTVVPSESSLAFLIMRSIIVNGQPEHPILRTAMAKYRELLVKDLAVAKAGALAGEIHEMINVTQNT